MKMMIKRVALPMIVAMSGFTGLPAHAVDPDMLGNGAPTVQFFVQPVVECNDITGANFQPATGGGVLVVSLNAGGLFAGVGFQPRDVILAVEGQPTNDVVNFCSLITSNKGNIVQLIIKDVNTGVFVNIDVVIPA